MANPFDKWVYDTAPSISSNNGMINPAPNTSQMSVAPQYTPAPQYSVAPKAPVPAVAPTTPKAPTTYIPKTPTIPNAVPSAVAAPPQISAVPMGTAATSAAMTQQAQTQMENRVIGAAQAAPGTVQTGAQMGKLPDGTPIMYQAYTQPNQTGNGFPAVSSTTQAATPTGTSVSGGGSATGGSAMGAKTNTEQKYVYDASAGGYVPADTKAIDASLEAYYDPNRKIAAAQADFKAAKEKSQSIYEEAVRQATKDFENRKQTQFSALAGIGTGINPLSSAGQSVANGNDSLLREFTHNLQLEKDARDAAAAAVLRGESSAAYDKQAEYQLEKRKSIVEQADKNYERSVNAQKDIQDKTLKALQIAAMEREPSIKEREDIQGTIKDGLTMYGSAAFENISDDVLREMEKKAGYPAGWINGQKKTLKEQEKKAAEEKRANYLQFVPESKYNKAGYFNKMTGEFVPYSNASNSSAKATGSGGGSGSGGGASVPKGFETDAQTELKNLSGGLKNWGEAWNSMKIRYPNVSNDLIDTFLSKDRWSQEGAYETQKQANFKQDTTLEDDVMSLING